MKLMIASDLHGSAYYVRKLMDAYAAEQPDRLLLLGDLLYHGPRNPLPRDYDCMAVAELLAGARDRIAAVRGNCDCEVDQMVLPFPVLADYALLEADGVWLYATPGHGAAQRPLPRARLPGARGLCVYEPGLRVHPQGGQRGQLHGGGAGDVFVEEPGRRDLPDLQREVSGYFEPVFIGCEYRFFDLSGRKRRAAQ